MKGFMQKKGIEKRLIALWLVFVMMLTPVITNLGGKKGTKAAGTALTYDVTSLGISANSGDLVVDSGDSSKYHINISSVSSKTVYVLGADDTIKFNIGSGKINNESASIKYKVGDGELLDDSPNVAVGETVGIYLSLENVTASDMNRVFNLGLPVDSTSYSIAPVKVAEYTVKKIELPEIKWVYADDSGAVTTDYANKAVKLSLESTPSVTEFETAVSDGSMTIVKKYKIVYSKSNSDTASTTVSDWKESVDDVEQVENTVTGTQYGYVGLKDITDFDPNSHTILDPTTYIKSVSVAMTTDATEPNVPTVGLSVDGNSDSSFDNAISDRYIVTGSTVNYSFAVSDNTGGVGVKSVTYAGESITFDSSGNVSIPVSKYSDDNNTLVIIDKAGNVRTVDTAFRKVFVLDPSFLDVVGYTVKAGETEVLTSPSVFASSPDYTYRKDASAFTISADVKTSKKVTKVEVKANGEVVASTTTIPAPSLDETNKCYVYTINDIATLRYAGDTKKFDDIQIIVTYNNNDSVTSTKSLGNLFCDSVAPENPTVKLQHKVGSTWSDYDSVYIDTSEDIGNYRYVISNPVDNENGSGFSATYAENVKVSGSENWDDTGSERTGAYSSSGDYTYTFNDDDKNAIAALTGAATYNNYILVKDKAGNVTSLALPALKKLETGISFGTIELKDSNGIIKHFTDSNLAVNDTYKLYVTVETGYPIDPAKVYLRKSADSGTATEFALDTTETVYGTTANDAGRYTSTLVFKMPSTDVTDNTQYNSITLYVTDNNNNNGNKTLGDLIYDNSHPYVEKLEYASGWVKESEATLTYEVVAGSDSVVESVLAAASYTIGGVSTDITPAPANNTTGEKVVSMPETTDPEVGTKIIFAATDNAGNTLTDLSGTKPYEATMLVDGHSPIVSALTVDGKNSFTAPLGGIPTISTSYTDNLALGKVDVTVTYPNGVSKVYTRSYDAYNGIGVNVSDSYSFQVEAVNGKAADGNYNISVVAYDKAGNKSVTNTIAFTVDNTAPVVELAIAGGTKGGKQPRPDGTDYYYSSNVPVSLEVEETNFTLNGVTVTDKVGNGAAKPVNVTWSKVGDKYVASMAATAEGHHVVTISAKDATGNEAVSKSVNFCIDKSAPGISLTLNGLAYQESRGTVDITSDAVVTASVSDLAEDKGDFNIQIIQTKPDQPTTTPAYVKTGSRSFGFSEEADYTVNLFAVDMTNNKSAVRTVSFRVDKTAPDLTISGAAGGGTSANAATVTFTMKEAFWWDAGGQVTIYRKAGDGKEEALLKTIDVKPTAFETSVSETLSDTGVYRFEFTGYDRAGHRVETTQSFTIDREAPVVTLTGVANYDMTTENVLFQAEILDDFYASKSVSVTGTVTDINGKVEKLTFNPYTTVANPTVITQEFTEDGIYDIEVSSTDAAGNSHSSKVHFVIDKTAPEIGDLSAFDGTILKSFVWDIDLDDLVSDLTVCDTHMYLNGSEYDGVSDIEDGSYTLLITAEDELGHMVEKSVSFVLDTKAPVFIITGVEDGEAKLEPYDISVSLQLDEDTLTEVALNGEAVEIVDNVANLTVSDNGEYTLTMKAIDEAGNEASDSIDFILGKEKKSNNWWIWLIIACGVVLVGAGVIIAVRKNSKED